MKTTLLLLFAGFPAFVFAQGSPAASTISHPSDDYDGSAGRNQIPASLISFEPGNPIPGFTAPNAVIEPIQCSDDGTVFLDSLLPPDYRTRLVSAVNSKGATAFSISDIPDLENIQVQDFFPSEHSLDYLATASTKSNDGHFTSENQAGRKATAFHQYILTFDKNGIFKKSVKLSEGTSFLRLGMLASGNIVLSGFDTANNIPRLILINPDGEMLRPLDLPSAFDKRGELEGLEQSGRPGGLAGSQIYSQGVFTAQSLGLVYSLRGSSSVLSITGDGTLREVQVKNPFGYTFDTLLSSNGKWIVRFRRAGLPTKGATDTSPESGNLLYFQVDPQDGSLLRELQLSSQQMTWLACEHDGQLTAFKTDAKSNLIPMSADIGK